MENSTKLALGLGATFLAGASFNEYLNKREALKRENEKRERRTRERLESQESELEELRSEITRLKGSN